MLLSFRAGNVGASRVLVWREPGAIVVRLRARVTHAQSTLVHFRLTINLLSCSRVKTSLVFFHFTVPRRKLRRAVLQFTPHRWTDFDWRPTGSLKRWLGTLILCAVILLTELNTFYLKYVLWVPPPHILCFLRLLFSILWGGPAIYEYFQYMDDPKHGGWDTARLPRPRQGSLDAEMLSHSLGYTPSRTIRDSEANSLVGTTTQLCSKQTLVNPSGVVRGSNPTSATRLPLSRLARPGNIQLHFAPSGIMVVRHRKGTRAEQRRSLLKLGEHKFDRALEIVEDSTTLPPDRLVARLLVVRGLDAFGLAAPLWPSWHGFTLWNEVPASVARGIIAALKPDHHVKVAALGRAGILQLRLLKIRRQPTTGFALFGAEQVGAVPGFPSTLCSTWNQIARNQRIYTHWQTNLV
ncbi:hypothetical protein T265_08343 [Opisthorchis viverrini]|uniref:Phosphatidylserine synthase n=1 Tax=Opisthorchis viverrini TaxID=6198 RepID=A0A075A8Q5_OPIVI|nr:hypothetical protein T265_08343 [Opisthorchis viverrini]KER23879.1 hypothetical protein T265_08343 [Opisthorchis viverrini]